MTCSILALQEHRAEEWKLLLYTWGDERKGDLLSLVEEGLQEIHSVLTEERKS